MQVDWTGYCKAHGGGRKLVTAMADSIAQLSHPQDIINRSCSPSPQTETAGCVAVGCRFH